MRVETTTNMMTDKVETTLLIGEYSFTFQNTLEELAYFTRRDFENCSSDEDGSVTLLCDDSFWEEFEELLLENNI